MGKSLRNVCLCHTNDLGPSKNDKIKGWVEHNGGIFSKELTDAVTHLIASPQAWKKKVPLVKEAMARRSIRIVKLDWLEDSLVGRSRRLLATLPYEFYPRSQTTLHRWSRPKRESCIQTDGIRFDTDCVKFVQCMAKKGYRIYKDDTGFIYSVYLMRNDVAENRMAKYRLKVRRSSLPVTSTTSYSLPLYYFPKPAPFSAFPVLKSLLHEDYTPRNPSLRVPVLNSWAQCLQLFESDNQPHTYASYLLYSTGGMKAQWGTVAAEGSNFGFAMELFEKQFRKKTSVEWKHRHESQTKSMRQINDGTADFCGFKCPDIETKETRTAGLSNDMDPMQSVTTGINDNSSYEQDLLARAPTPQSNW